MNLYPLSACGHRWPRPPHGSALLHRRQVHSERQQSGRCALRGHQHERQLLQEQAEVSEVPATPVQCEAAQGSLSFPCAFQDLLADGEGYDSAQIRARKGGTQEASDVRGHPASLRQEEEDGHPLCPPGAQAQAWQEGKAIGCHVLP